MTAYSRISSLKFDETKIGLGEELRAARAHLGRTVDDVESALRIRAKYVEAIENLDRSELPDRAYADGFIKTYARYLGLDPDDTLARFDAEAAQVSAARNGMSGRAARDAGKRAAGASNVNPLAGYEKSAGVGSWIGGLFRMIFSLWPLALLAAIAFGAWYGFQAARDAGMIPESLTVIGEAEEITPVFEANISENDLNAASGGTLLERPSELSYANLGVVPYWHAPEVETDPRDGPIRDIEAETAGVFPPRVLPASPVVTETPQGSGEAFDARQIAAEARAALTAEIMRGTSIDGAASEDNVTNTSAASVPTAMATMGNIALVAHADTWIEVRDTSGKISYTGVLSPGETVPLNEGVDQRVKIGNAGGLFVKIGNAEYGPFGNSGSVMRDVALERTALLSRFAGTAQ